jgi:hypothetical protein
MGEFIKLSQVTPERCISSLKLSNPVLKFT